MFGPRIIQWFLLVFIAISASRAEALDVQKTLWGFDGHIVPGYFSPISALVSNSGDRPFDGDMTCTEIAGIGGQRGAEYFQPLYVAPHSARWVQFYVFIANGQTEFELSWGKHSNEQLRLQDPIVPGPPACVWLFDESNPFSRFGGFKSFPDSLFPTSAAATDSLDSVILDYAPRWESARRDAFLDWIKRGGTVHILRGADGNYPLFSESLEPLNSSADRTRIGSGWVVRHAVPAQQVTPPYLTQQGFSPRALKQEQNPAVFDLEGTFFQHLSKLTRPEIAWGVITLITIIYLILMGPVHFFWRRKLEYRVSIAAFLGSVVLFGATFAMVGRRGYNESQTVHSLSIARALDAGRWDVTQWISAFATSGDLYALGHVAPYNLYAAPSSTETVRGKIFNGKDGRFFADIPLFSSIAFMHRAVMQGEDTSVTVEDWKLQGSVLSELRLKPGPKFPKNVIEIRVRSGDTIRELTLRNGAYELKTQAGEAMKDFLSADKLRQASIDSPYSNGGNVPDLNSVLPLLYARAVGVLGSSAQTLAERPMPPERLQLFVAAHNPAGFQMEGKGFTRETGLVLYVQDLFKP